MRLSAIFLALPLALALVEDIPDYVMVSPDHVALAPSGPQGLNANALNNMICLANRFRYDMGLPSLALDAQLVRYAQQRAQELSDNKSNIANNQVNGQISPISFNTTYWSDVSENLLQTTNNPTFAYWEMQQSEDMAANLASQDYMFFGAGLYNGYYVQAFGAPVGSNDFNQNLFPPCPANQTFYNWVYPNGMSNPPKDKSQLLNTAFPYDAVAKVSPKYYIDRNPYYDNGRTNDTVYYFTPELGNVPFLKSLAVSDIVAGANTQTPYAATADSGEQGMTKDELNLMTCLINARRYKSCLPPVALNSQLIAAAQAHSYEMNFALNMSHYGASGWPGDRIKRRGFIFGSVGENVVANTHDVYGAHVTFSQSQGHLDNILGAGYTFIGAGRSGQFWTVDFGNYLDQSISPNPAEFPLCPGNETAIAIAFPDGLPTQPKLDATACGNTEATSVVAPPYIQSQYSLASAGVTAQPTSSAVGGAGVAFVTITDVVTQYGSPTTEVSIPLLTTSTPTATSSTEMTSSEMTSVQQSSTDMTSMDMTSVQQSSTDMTSMDMTSVDTASTDTISTVSPTETSSSTDTAFTQMSSMDMSSMEMSSMDMSSTVSPTETSLSAESSPAPTTSSETDTTTESQLKSFTLSVLSTGTAVLYSPLNMMANNVQLIVPV